MSDLVPARLRYARFDAFIDCFVNNLRGCVHLSRLAELQTACNNVLRSISAFLKIVSRGRRLRNDVEISVDFSVNSLSVRKLENQGISE